MKRAQKIFRPSCVSVALPGLALVGLWVLLSGCEPPSGPPGARPAMPPSSISAAPTIPPQPARNEPPSPVAAPPNMPDTKDNTQDNLKKTTEPTDKTPEGHTSDVGERKLNPLAPVFKVERAGYAIKLASEVLFSQANPFLDLLSRPSAILPVANTGGAPAMPMEPPPPPDPFTHVNLLGVAYSPVSPMAVVSLNGDESSRLVRRGDILATDEGRLRVRRIERDGIELEAMEKTLGKRTLTLPNVIGYAPGGAKEEKRAPSEQKTSATEAGASTATALGGNQSANMTTSDAASPEAGALFQNLQKLAGEGLIKKQQPSAVNPVSKF